MLLQGGEPRVLGQSASARLRTPNRYVAVASRVDVERASREGSVSLRGRGKEANQFCRDRFGLYFGAEVAQAGQLADTEVGESA